MYLRTIKRKNKDGSVVEYVQLAHNVRHPVKGYPKAEVIHSFGRREQLDVEGLKRLVSSISRFIELDETRAVPPARPGPDAMAFVRSLPVGGILLLHALWDRFDINGCLQKALAPQALPVSCQNALFARVASSTLAPFAAPLTTEQIASTFFLFGQANAFADRHVDQAIEMLHGHTDTVQQAVFRAVASHLKMDLDLVLVHLISASVMNDRCESTFGGQDPGGLHFTPVGPGDGTICLAVSQAGIPIGCWLMPGNPIDADGIQTVEGNLTQWSPHQVVWVIDRMATGDTHQAALQQSGCTYILGQKLRDSGGAEEAKTPKGRFKILGPDLQIKAQAQKGRSSGRQSVIAYHPGQAAFDRRVRQHHLLYLRRQLEHWNAHKSPGQAATSRQHHGLARYLKIPESGVPKIDRARVRQDEKQDGKYLIMSNDNRLTPEILARGHKQLLDLDQIYRELMPGIQTALASSSSSDDLTDAGMLLAWLTLLFRRVAELQTDMPWKDLCRDMQALHLGEFADGNHRIFKYTALTARQKKILQHLCIDLPDVGHRFDDPA